MFTQCSGEVRGQSDLVFRDNAQVSRCSCVPSIILMQEYLNKTTTVTPNTSTYLYISCFIPHTVICMYNIIAPELTMHIYICSCSSRTNLDTVQQWPLIGELHFYLLLKDLPEKYYPIILSTNTKKPVPQSNVQTTPHTMTLCEEVIPYIQILLSQN